MGVTLSLPGQRSRMERWRGFCQVSSKIKSSFRRCGNCGQTHILKDGGRAGGGTRAVRDGGESSEQWNLEDHILGRQTDAEGCFSLWIPGS